MRLHTYLLILICLLAVSCGPAASPAATSTPLATTAADSATAPATRVVPTATLTPPLTATPAPTQSATETATASPAATAPLVQTETPPGPEPTLDEFPAPLAQQSPDGRWQWEIEPNFSPDGWDMGTTRIISADGKTEWKVQPSRGEVGNWRKAYYWPFFWSPNDPYVFLTGVICCVEGSGTVYSYTSLIRLNLQTGLVSTFVPWGSYHAFSFSPDGKYMNRSTLGEHSLHITRLLDGRSLEVKLPESYSDVSAGRWSPDGKHFVVYVCVEDPVEHEFCKTQPTLMLDPELETYQVLATFTLGQAWDTKWVDAKHFQITEDMDRNETKIYNVEIQQFER